MARNIEIKMRLNDSAGTLKAIQDIAEDADILWQEDTFFTCNYGRLKLRREGHDSEAGELIFYDRGNSPGPIASRYLRCDVSNATQMKDLLVMALGFAGHVKKRRQVFHIGKARVHVDEVEGLAGVFLEIEVVLGEGDSFQSGLVTMESILKQLSLGTNSYMAEAYVDLLRKERHVQ